MNASRPTEAGKPKPRELDPSIRLAHVRQRELVRASLVCRPGVQRATHRRWA
jgi:hypothetical protein